MMSRLLGKLGCLMILALTLVSGAALAEQKVTVFAAASLANAIDEVAAEYKQQHQIEIVTSYASSSTLARQIEQGAPADIFISADQNWMNYLVDKKLVSADFRMTLLANKLVLVAPVNSKLTNVVIDKDTDWLALLDGGRLAVGDPDHVPVGLYAKQAFQSLGQWDKVSPMLARTDNVRSALLLVERQESPLGIVYATDAAISDKVKIVAEFPVNSHDPVEYPLAIVTGHNQESAASFYLYLQSSTAKTIFAKYGFNTLS